MLTGTDRDENGHAASGAASEIANDEDNVISLGRAEQAEIGQKLRDLYDGVAAEPLPEDVSDAMAQIEQKLREIKND